MDLYIKPDRSFNFYQGYYFSKSIMASHTRSILDLHKLVCACIFAVCGRSCTKKLPNYDILYKLTQFDAV